MCGIAGIRKMDADGNIRPEQLKLLALSLEYRGKDATGFALQKASGEVLVHKAANSARVFVDLPATREFLASHLSPDIVTALVHTRAKTQGTPYKNENNHPMHSGTSAVVHNGHVWNDDELFAASGLERKAETDSDIIRAIFDRDGLTEAALEPLREMTGSVASAIIHPDFPGQVMLLRSSNPLVVAGTDSQLIWASDMASVYKTAPEWVTRWGIPMQLRSKLGVLPMPDDTAWMIGAEGKEWHREFKLSSYSYGYRPGKPPKQGRASGTWWPELIACPNKHSLRLKPKQRRLETLTGLHCTVCQADLVDPK